jgi:F-type H+-transporting ATPase subunit b
MDLLQPNPGLQVWTALTFILLYIVLGKYVWKPLSAALNERERKIRESLDAADEAKKHADESLAKQEEILNQARQEAQGLIAQGKKTAEAVREELITKARSDADTLVDRAKKEIVQEREKALDDLRKLAVDLSITATQKVIGKALSDKDHEDLVGQSLQELGELKN